MNQSLFALAMKYELKKNQKEDTLVKLKVSINDLAAQTAQKVESHTNRSHVLQDWVFELGFKS